MQQSFNFYRKFLVRYLKPQRGKVLFMGLTLLTAIGLQLLLPQILRGFIDQTLSSAPPSSLAKLSLFFLSVSVVHQLFAIGATYLSADVGWSATNLLREDLTDHCLHLEMAFHNQRTPGELIERIDGDITNLSNFFSQFIIQILGSTLLSTGILLLLFRESLWAGFMALLFALATLALLFRMKDLAVEASHAQRNASSKLFGFFVEKLSGLDDLRAHGAGPYVMDRFLRTNHRFFHASRKAWMLRSLFVVVLIGVFSVGDVTAIGTGVVLYERGWISLGTIFLFFHYIEMLRTPLEQISRQLQDLQNATASLGRVESLLQLPRTWSSIGTLGLPSKPLAIAFDHVTFAYTPCHPVLKDISFRLEAGQRLGLLGRTGSGKSTLIRLLFRLYDSTEGQISIEGTAIQKFDLRQLRENIGLVTQEVQLFEGSIRENLTFFSPTVTPSELLRVIERLELSSWFEQLPSGLDTPLSSRGSNLSAGEAQLIAFIRVFLKDPGLVILDEPSSRLDPTSQQWVNKAIGKLIQHRTVILIAHQLSSMSLVDELLILDGGRIVEHGPRKELQRDSASRFSRLIRAEQDGISV